VPLTAQTRTTTGLRRSLLVALALGVIAAQQSAPAAAAPSQQQQLSQARAQLESVVEQYNQVREDLAVTRKRLAALKPQLAPMQAKVAAQRGQVGELAAGAYRSAAMYRVGALLSAPNPSQLTARLAMVQQLADQRQDLIHQLAEAEHSYTKAQHELSGLAAAQAKQQAQLASRRNRIELQIAQLTPTIVTASTRNNNNDDDPGTPRTPPAAPGSAGSALHFAFSQLGKPYGWGAEGPYAYDCSGFTRASWLRGGRSLPHNAAMQWQSIQHIERGQLRPGDLVFYYSYVTHVGMYIGNGRIIHAPTFGENVKISGMDYAPIHGFGRP